MVIDENNKNWKFMIYGKPTTIDSRIIIREYAQIHNKSAIKK